MKILVSGCTGIVGKNLVELIKNDPTVEGCIGISRYADWTYDTHPSRNLTKLTKYIEYRCDLIDFNPVRQLLYEFQPNIIYNFAATSTSNSEPDLVWKNTQITLNLLEGCKQVELKPKFIQASSLTIENRPRNVYSCSKLACEELVNTYKELYGILGLNVRFPAVVGLGNSHGLLKDVVKKIQDSYTDKDIFPSIELFGEKPGSTKPYVYVKNLVELIYLVSNKDSKSMYYKYPFITICPNNCLSVERVANIVMKKMNTYREIIWNPSKVWKGDQNVVRSLGKYNFFQDKVCTSQQAIELAVQDILGEANETNETKQGLVIRHNRRNG